MKIHLLYFLLLLLIFPSHLISQTDLTSLFEKKYKKPLKKNDIVGMSFGLIDNGKILHKQDFGYEDKENEIKASSKTQYKIGSISKVFTALALLKLQEVGKVDINKSILEYIPELAIKSRFEEKNTLLIKDILCHSSGLPSDMVNGMFSQDVKNFDWITEKVNQQYMASYPKYEFSYSNLGYGFLGELISRISGETYVDYMRKEVFEPLGLNDTYVFNGEETLSKAYIKNELYKPDMIRDKAAGSVVSTVDDMLNFLLFFINEGKSNGEQFLSKESMSLLEVNFLDGNVVESPFNYSLGLFIRPCKILKGSLSELDTLIEHGGDTNAFHASFGYLKHKKLGGVILTNSENGDKVRSLPRLLNYYINEKQGLLLKPSYSIQQSIQESLNNPISEKELIGRYILSKKIISVDKRNKFSLKLKKSKFVFKEDKKRNRYKVIPKLWGIIPFNKKEEIVFFRRDENIYISRYIIKKNLYSVVGIKLQESKLHSDWISKTGTYEPIDVIETSFKELYLNGFCNLSVEEDFLKLSFPADYFIPELLFQAENENMAFSQGIGRNTGYSLTVLENGNLSFMGYELKKVE